MIDVIHDLEIEHAHAYKIGTVTKCELESFFRWNRPGGENFIGENRLFSIMNILNRQFGIKAPHVVMIGSLSGYIGSHYTKRIPVLFPKR